jgi:hypothetical protein
MPEFRVEIRGSNFEIGVIKRRFLFWKTLHQQKVGFYTTRFVERDNANDAIAAVLGILAAELEADGRSTTHSVMEVLEIQEDDDAFDLYAPGAGFTFYFDGGSTFA